MGALPWVMHCCVFEVQIASIFCRVCVNRVQVVLSGFSMRLFCFVVQTKTVCGYGCIYFLAALMLVCGCEFDGDANCIGHDLNQCTGWW